MAVIEIALEGGPCAGKTTAQSYVIQKLQDHGIRVFIVPEVASMFIHPGVPELQRLDRTRYMSIEHEMVDLQQQLRKAYRRIAELFPEDFCVIINDRGTAGYAAYIGDEGFTEIMDEQGLTWWDVRDSYDGVIHLVSAARGAEEFYNFDNPARLEDVEKAKEADLRTLNAWVGHPHLYIINNETDFETKMKKTFEAITHICGIPTPLEIERKFLLQNPPSSVLLELMQKTQIFQTYLMPTKTMLGEVEVRVRCRSYKGQKTYYRTEKRWVNERTREEVERVIDEREYNDLLLQQDPTTGMVVKDRYGWIWKDQYFEIDHIKSPQDLWLLEIELMKEDQEVEIPEILGPYTEVTGQKEYTNRYISMG